MKPAYIFLPALLLLIASCSEHTDPAKLINTDASLPAAFNFSQMGLLVVSSSINQPNATMSTLYGNAKALAALKAGDGIKPDEVLAYITWKQKDDEHWFGAKIPGQLQSLELIKTAGTVPGDTKISYKRFVGAKLSQVRDTAGSAQSIQYIMTQKPSVMP